MARIVSLLFMLVFFSFAAAAFTGADLAAANKYYDEKSYQLAASEFARFLDEKGDEALQREVSFKWSDAVLQAKDEAGREKAEKRLRSLIDGKEQDRWRAEAQASLALHYIERDPYGKAQEIKKWLDEARDWWAGSADMDLARRKFIDISFALADFNTSRWGWYVTDIRPVRLGERGDAAAPADNLGLKILFEEILKVADTDADKARAHYGLGMFYMQGPGDEKQRRKAIEAFETVIDDYEDTEWADDAWYQIGNYHEGRSDYVEAMEAWRGLLKEFGAGQSQWVDDAKRRLEQITSPDLSLTVSHTFVPGSEIRFGMGWRNLKQADMALYRLDLSKELRLENDTSGYNSYQELLRLLVDSGRYSSLPLHLSWKADLGDDGKHVPKNAHKGLAEWRAEEDEDPDAGAGLLPEGAYLLVATAGSKKAYDLVLVSDMALVSKTAGNMSLFLAMNAKTGKPIPNADISYIYSYYDSSGTTRWERGAGRTGEDGLLRAALREDAPKGYSQHHNLFATATAGGQQAFVQSYYNHYNHNNKGEWWLYAFTDRPAYRPNEEVGFKAILRHPENGAFAVQPGMAVKARIYDAQGNQVKEGSYRLNDYGAFDDKLMLDGKAVLGEYRLQVYTADNAHLANVPLFRLEEYKLPEYLVNVRPEPRPESSAAGYRLGDIVKVTVDAQYYFGGPVADAQVEYLVYQQPYYHQFRREREFPWYYDDHARNNYYYGHGQLVKTEKIKTDKDGKASFGIETPKDSGNDLMYRVEVRVVDQSRREIRSTAEIKVTRNAFFAHVEAAQNLYRPGDKAKVKIRTLTANGEPVAVEGKITVLRNSWRAPVMRDDRIVSPAGYAGQEMLTKFVKTDAKGEAVFEFEPNENGYYAVEFTGFDEGREVKGAAQVFVCDTAAKNIGYQHSGLQIIMEKDTYAPGETARAMVVSDVPDTWVLLTTEADAIHHYQMLHLEGSVRLVELPVRSAYTPNVFISAVSGSHYQLKLASLEVIVPPAEKFLNVAVTSDKAVYQPREEGVFDITVTDKDGKPVSGEIALGLVDASVYYIQDELAADIRQFFYGDKRPQSIQTQASFYQRPYVRLVRGENEQLMTEEEQARQDRPVPPLGGGMEMDEMRVNAVGMKDDAGRREGKVMGQLAASEAAPAAAAPREKALAKVSADKKEAPAAPGEAESPAQVREDFRSTIVWLPAVQTDAQGKAKITVTFPDSLTTWRLTARAVAAGTAVGTMTHEVKSNKELMIRLQAPRFFTERDLAAVSALIDNLSDKPVTVTPVIRTEGLAVTGLYRDGSFVKGQPGPIEVPAKGQARMDWAVSAQQAGMAKIMVSVAAGNLSDAMQKIYPVIPHGIEKFVAQSAVLKNGGEREISITIPRERIKESASLRLTLSPSLAANLLDALPYLADYPYGCVEQTMSRFLPAVVVAKTMKDLGLSPAEVDGYIGDVLAPRGDPKGHPQRRPDTTYSKVGRMTDEGLKRLYDFQHGDGGWGWWKDGDSDRFMTAYVVWGMGLARAAGIDVRGDVVSRGVDYLRNQLVEEENAPDMLAWMLHAIAHVDAGPDQRSDRQRSRLWEMRQKLNPYSRALYAIAEHRFGNPERSRVLAQNIINGISEDKENGTAHWGESGIHYRWSEGGVEATAFGISALSQMDPQSAYLEPAVKWMSLNRRGASWKNTRDTAIAILGLTEYLKASRELSPNYSYRVLLNGETVREGKADASNVFSFDRIVDIPAEKLRDGDNSVRIVMKGAGALYVAAYAKYFTLEERVTKAGNEIFVTRRYFVQSVKETLMKGYTDAWKPLEDGAKVQSGDRIRVEMTMDAKNHYEYLVAEDYKPAGLEAVELVSGPGEAIALDSEGRETQERTPLYQEFRDQKAAFFISKLKQGRHLIRYELRAEIPGVFHAMPNQSHAMYVPEIRANSDEMRIEVHDAADSGKQ